MLSVSLFSGGGGGLLGELLLGWQHVAYVEIDDYAQRIIAQRIADGILERAPIFGDIGAFNRDGYAKQYRGMVDVVSAGFPCQFVSSAARGNNTARNLWVDTVVSIARIRPRTVFLENVVPVLKHAHTIFQDLEALGYRVRRPVICPAAFVGAPHIRERVWIMADAHDPTQPDLAVDGEAMAGERESFQIPGTNWFESEPRISGMDDGMADRMERYRLTGNGQVPAVVQAAWHALLEQPYRKPIPGIG